VRHRLLAGLAVVVSATACGGSPREAVAGTCREWVAAPAYAPEIAQARPLVARMRRAFAAPGLSVAVGANGTLVWSESCGWADLARRVPVRRTTRFRIGSLSKPITAAAAARLSQARRLDLDADIRRYVASFPHRVTARQLGGHLAGIRHYRGAEALNTVHYDSVADSLRVFARDPLVAAPGERYSYSSYGFNLLGAAVEAAAGAPFPAAVESLVLRPLGMRSTGLEPDGRTRFYEVTGARRAVPAPRIDLSDRAPSGGFYSTAEDLVRLGLGVTTPAFLDARSRRLLFTTQRTRSGERTGYGFGWELHDSPFGVVAGHTGNVVGGTAFILVHPRTRVVVALVTNIGFVTAARPPELRGTPDPPALALPFVRHVLSG
jgi:serine beta-lactamase-like protein LACTB, mitochondrial